MKDRFAKLVALTRGAAVVTLGMGTAGTVGACTKNDPAAPPRNVNGVIQPDIAAADAPDAGSLPFNHRRFPVPNAMPGRGIRDRIDGISDGGSNDGS